MSGVLCIRIRVGWPRADGTRRGCFVSTSNRRRPVDGSVVVWPVSIFYDCRRRLLTPWPGRIVQRLFVSGVNAAAALRSDVCRVKRRNDRRFQTRRRCYTDAIRDPAADRHRRANLVRPRETGNGWIVLPTEISAQEINRTGNLIVQKIKQ